MFICLCHARVLAFVSVCADFVQSQTPLLFCRLRHSILHFLQCRQETETAYGTKQGRRHGKYGDDFYLRPAAHLKMVVDRGHLKDSLAVGDLEIPNISK